MDYFLLCIFSLLIGSFLNVVIRRIPRRQSIIWPGSHCTSCGNRLSISDLIPVFSYIYLRGQCRYCRSRISFQYPLIEIMTAVLFLMIYHKWGLSLASLSGCFFTAILLVAAFTDINEGIIPDIINYFGIITGVIFAYLGGGVGEALLGIGSFGGFLLLIAILSRGGMGGGDVKLAAVIGAYLGFKGAVMVFVLSSCGGALWVLPRLLSGKDDRKSAVKFGPFLSAAAGVTLFYGQDLFTWYLSWLTGL